MKYASIVLLGLIIAAVPMSPTIAQVADSTTTNTYRRSELLLTEPIALNQSTTAANIRVERTYADRLTQVANSIHAKPTPEKSVIPGNLIPQDLIHTSSKLLPDSHPLNIFQVDKPDPSVGINLNKL